MDRQSLIKSYQQQFPSLFNKLLMCWKDSPTHNNWVLEKVMEVFCRDIAKDVELVKATSFHSFLEGFLEDSNPVWYPDFVMNNVSLMAAEVLISSSQDGADMEKTAFKIIRSPLEYWMVTKGHRADVTFQILKNFVEQRRMLDLMDGVDFDASQAFAYCLASPQNYTRKSTSEYLVELVKSSFDNNFVASHIKSKLKQTISQLSHQYNEKFTESFINKENNGLEKLHPCHRGPQTNYGLSAVANYCKLLSDFSETSEGWNQEYSQTDMFDVVIMLLKAVASDISVDFADLYRACTLMLLRFVNTCHEEEKTPRFKKLLNLLGYLCDTKNYHLLCDVVYMAGQILMGTTCSTEDQRLLFEMCLLPLYVIFDVKPVCTLSLFPSVLGTMHSCLEKEQKSKPSLLLKEAVGNLALLVEKKIVPSCHPSLIDYLTLKSLDPPSEIGTPLLSGDYIRNEILLNYLVLELAQIRQARGDNIDRSRLSCVQAYTKACLNHASISHMQLSVIMKSYVDALQCVTETMKLNSTSMDEDDSLLDKGIFQEVLFKIQVKMVDVNSYVRELAVETLGDLGVLDCQVLQDLLKNQDCLPSLWQCVEDRSEGVVTKVLEFIWKATNTEKMEDVLDLMNVTKDVVQSRIQEFLLSSQWDNIKPVAFKILTKISHHGILVRYAEACLGQSNSQLAQAVLDYVHILFSKAEDENLCLETRTERVITLLREGWGDLVLNEANAADVCSFRMSASVMEELAKFIERQDVSVYIDTKLSDFLAMIEVTGSGHSPGVPDKFAAVCEEIMGLHGHGSLQSKTLNGNSGSQAFDSQSSCETSEVSSNKIKRKWPSNNDVESSEPSAKIGKFEPEIHMNLVRCIFCSLIDNQSSDKEINALPQCDSKPIDSEKEGHASTNNSELLLNSTEELPALTLKTEAFPSQKVIGSLFFNSRVNQDSVLSSSATSLTTLLVFKYVLQNINPQMLKEEAQRSTDEYERNAHIVLHDLDNVLNRSLQQATKDLEKELLVLFITSFAGFVEPVTGISDSGQRQKLCRDAVLFVKEIQQVLDNEEQLVAFVLKNRQSVLQHEQTDSCFSLESFMKRMAYLKRHGTSGLKVKRYFHSSEGLKDLLRLFCKGENAGLEKSDPQKKQFMFGDSVCDNQDRSDGRVKVNQESNQEMCGKVSLMLQKSCQNAFKEDIAHILFNLEADEICDISHLFSQDIESQETLKRSLDALVKSEKKELTPVLEFLLKLTQWLFLIIFEKNENSKVEMLSGFNVLFGNLENWCMSEDDEFDSEGDNDPAALDCF